MYYEIIVILIVNILHTSLLKKVFDAFLSAENKNGKLLKTVYAGYYLAATVSYIAFHMSIPYGICNLAGIIFVACFYCAAWEKKLWISMFFLCLDIGCGAAVSFAASDEIRMQQSAVHVLLLLAGVMIICQIPDPEEGRKIAIDKKQMRLLLMIPVLSVISFLMLICGSIDRLTAVFLCAVIVSVNLCVFYLYHVLLNNYIRLREQDIYKQQTYAYRNQLDVIMESQGRIRALSHDMKNHVLMLQGLAKGLESEDMMRYLASMQEFMQNPSEHVYTGNEALDSLLNYKLQRAEEELKKVETDIVLPEKMKLHSFDFNVIMGNLLDNGIAASMQTDERFLKLSIRMENGVLLLHMVNSCSGIPQGECEIHRLPEKSVAGHVIGLANVKRVVEKYHGDMEMYCEENHMNTEIILYMKEL